MIDWFFAGLGGVLIGVASALLLAFQGRIFGVSGILGGLMSPRGFDARWRLAVLAGLLAGGVAMHLAGAPVFDAEHPRASALVMIIAGVLVGYGTRLGNGCTSGHGVCGVSRLSRRSIVATLVFVMSAMLTATVASIAAGGKL